MTFKIDDGALLIANQAYVPYKIIDTQLPGGSFRQLGVHLQFSNGYKLSIQWGTGTYSDNRYTFTPNEQPFAEEVKLAELAAWDSAGFWVEWPGGSEVCGYVDSADANLIIEYFMTGDYNEDEFHDILSMFAHGEG